MSGHLDAIVTLHTTLIELAAAEQRLNTIPEWMRELHEEHSGRKAEIEAVEAEGLAAEQERRESEAALSDAEEQQKRYQEQLGRVSTQREYGAPSVEARIASLAQWQGNRDPEHRVGIVCLDQPENVNIGAFAPGQGNLEGRGHAHSPLPGG